MRNSPLVLVLAVACCLAFSPEAKGSDVYSWSGVNYEPELGSMRAFVQMYASYDTQLYYCVGIGGYVYENEVEIGRIYAVDEAGNGYTACGGWALAEQYYPYDPNAEYTMEAIPELNVTLRGGNEYYYDYYSYIEYTYGEPVYYPNSYSFIGRGPENPVNLQSILLGTLTSGFSMGGASGLPHHVKVVSDETSDVCGSKRRRITFQVVDSNGRNAGTVTVKESFFDQQSGTPRPSVYNTCRDETISPSGCAPTDLGTNGKFGDQLWVGCPSVTGDCGASEIISRWSWCPRGRPEVALTTNTYHARRNFALINGLASYDPGTHLY